MPVMRSSLKKSRAKNSVYGQILIVCLAFTVMVVASYLFVGRIMRSHLTNETKTTLNLMRDSIEADLLEPETLILTISWTVRDMIIQGYGPDRVREFIEDISHNVIRKEERKMAINGLYGYFDVYEKFINDGVWTPPEDFEPKERLWYKTAVAAGGKVAFSAPYRTLVTGTDGFVISCSYLIVEEGRQLGVISMDLMLHKITDFVVGTKVADDGYGVLMNGDLEILAHPDPRQVGRYLADMDSGIAPLSDILRKGQDVSGEIVKNYIGLESIVFFRQLNTGWCVGLVTPVSRYFQEIRNMGLVLAAIGLVLAALLSIILWRIALAKSKSDAENKQKSEFLATMSHEIRTPMNAILGITEIHLQDKSLRDDIKDALGKIYNSGALLLSIINDILDLSKIEAGKLELVPVKYNIASLINDVVQLNKIRHENKPIEFKLKVDDTIPLVMMGDELRIKQILNNLLSNAFKYTDKGTVFLSVGVEYALRGASTQVPLIFTVSDTGQGMTAEQVRKLFDEYSRFNMEANRATQGTGLGMTITRNLVQMMDGTISVESAPGKGTTVIVRLPQRNIGTAVAGMVGKELAENLEQFRMSNVSQSERAQLVYDPMPYGSVLVVDDVETNLYVAKGLMAPYEMSIETVVSGFDAIDRIKEGKVYDIVFMDHMMPKMDGIETTKKMRDLGYTHPVIALTANALTGQAEMFMKNGFDGFISKPIDVRQLNVLLNKLVRDKQPYEVIEAARRQKAERQAAAGKPAPSVLRLSETFAPDIERAVATLEIICKNEFRRNSDVDVFIITVHAMQGALKNIGETELAALALKLEEAGRNRNTDVLTAETPAFLKALRDVSGKLKSQGDGKGVTEDRAFLHEKLLVVQGACAIKDKKTSKDALVELKRKPWSLPTKELINTLIEQVMKENFEEAATLAKEFDETYQDVGEEQDQAQPQPGG